MIIVPLWDPAAIAREIERCAGKGVTAVAFSENPEPLVFWFSSVPVPGIEPPISAPNADAANPSAAAITIVCNFFTEPPK
jgi:hypothetical protein